MSRKRRDFCPVLAKRPTAESRAAAVHDKMQADMESAAKNPAYVRAIFDAMEAALSEPGSYVKITFKNYGEMVLAGETIESTMHDTGPGRGFGVSGELVKMWFNEALRATEMRFLNGSTVLLAVEQRQETKDGTQEEGRRAGAGGGGGDAAGGTSGP